MLCNKIFKNPRKSFLQLPDRGMNKINKTNIFSNPTSLMECFTEKGAFWAALMYIVQTCSLLLGIVVHVCFFRRLLALYIP